MPVSDEQVIRDRLDLEMIERPHLWPSMRRGMPCVFLKRGGTGDHHREGGPCFQTKDGYMVMAHDWESEEPLKAAPMSYDSADAVVADGWIVD